MSYPLLDASRKEPVFEAPGSTLEFNPDGYMEVELASGRTLRVQAVEEVLLLRLDEFVATGNADVFQQCLWLLGASALDRERLQRRAGEQSLARALDAVERTARKIEQELVDASSVPADSTSSNSGGILRGFDSRRLHNGHCANHARSVRDARQPSQATATSSASQI